MEPSKATSVNSRAEELFVQLFCEAFGPEKTENLQVQYPCVDIYGRHRYIDFALESPESKIAIEIDGETYHNPSKVSENKYADDLLKQNSLIYDNWKVYRWIYSQLEKQPEKGQDELITFWAAVRCSRLLKQIFQFRWGRPSNFGITSRKPPKTCRRCVRTAKPLRCCTMQPAQEKPSRQQRMPRQWVGARCFWSTP